MIINDLSSAQSPLKSDRRAPVSGFLMPEPLTAPEATVAAAGVQGASLLALQEEATPQARDRVARGRCAALLAALCRLQRALLRGSADDAVADLARIACEPENAADPALRGVIAMTRLRVRIELARHNRS